MLHRGPYVESRSGDHLGAVNLMKQSCGRLTKTLAAWKHHVRHVLGLFIVYKRSCLQTIFSPSLLTPLHLTMVAVDNGNVIELESLRWLKPRLQTLESHNGNLLEDWLSLEGVDS